MQDPEHHDGARDAAWRDARMREVALERADRAVGLSSECFEWRATLEGAFLCADRAVGASSDGEASMYS